MSENTIDFLWRHSARPDAQAHRVDQVLMNIKVNLMKEQKKRGEERQARSRLEKDELIKSLEEFKYCKDYGCYIANSKIWQ